MGAPSINISFIEKAITAVARGERGIVMLWVKDSLPAAAKNPITVTTESDIPEGLGEGTVEQVKLAMLGYVNAPKKVLVYCMGIPENKPGDVANGEENEPGDVADREENEPGGESSLAGEGDSPASENSGVEKGYKQAMEASETIRFDYLAVPGVETDGKAQDVAAWVKSMRGNKKKKVKAVLPNTAADNEGVINFTTGQSIKAETVTGKDGQKEVKEKVYTAEQYCARIAGLIAGTPMDIACTYAPLMELSDCTRLTDIDTPVDKGEFILFHDGEKVKVVRGVNSFVTTVDGKGGSFKKIKIVEAMDMINDDIVKTAQDSYLGKYANTYSNKCLLITAISGYFAQLKRDGIVNRYSVGLDAKAIRLYLKERGLQATLDNGTVKDTDECSDEEIITADTGTNVFLIGNAKILDAIEDINMPIYI